MRVADCGTVMARVVGAGAMGLLAVQAWAQAVPAAVKTAEQGIDAERIRAHVRFLADDLLEGRGPGLRGAEIAAKYMATQFALDGLKPGGNDGTYLQQVKFVGMKVVPGKTSYAFEPKGGAAVPLTYGDDYTVSDQALGAVADFDAPIVFVGYGVKAPEFGWDDYAGVDVKGKVVLCIVGDPPSDDPTFFGGKALTYYGRWTYKFEEAARQGAVGALIIHRTDLASYGWDVVKNSNTSEKTYLAEDKNREAGGGELDPAGCGKKAVCGGGQGCDGGDGGSGKEGLQGGGVANDAEGACGERGAAV